MTAGGEKTVRSACCTTGRSIFRLSGWTLLAAALFLTACSGHPTRTETDAGSKKAAQKRGGGYYKDDGPADEIPVDLDEIPDAQPRFEPLHRFANRPYVVLGRSYVPNTSLKPVRQRGIASWYGKKFHGQKTSIGETYNMFAMTAAHPTLALPSYARVTNVNNGKSVVVRINDRGPFHASRIIDLSYVAAHRLGYIGRGSTLVEVESLLPTASTSPLTVNAPPVVLPSKTDADKPANDEFEQLMSQLATDDIELEEKQEAVITSETQKGIFLQLGAFSSVDNAESLRSHLSRELDWLVEAIWIQTDGNTHKVQLGPYDNRGDAEKVADKIHQELGYTPAFVVR